MSDLFSYNHDGAGYQARAVLAFLSGHDGIEESWETSEYRARPSVARWHNCREQGYVVSMRGAGDTPDQLNIAFFEHRNSDDICAVEWEQWTMNPPNIDTAQFGSGVYRDKYDVSYSVRYGNAHKMADWIYERLERFWKITDNQKAHVDAEAEARADIELEA